MRRPGGENIPRFTQENQEKIERLILLLLGTSKSSRLSLLHIQKELFVLQRSSGSLADLFLFVPHYKGPFSKEISEAIVTPLCLDDLWTYSSPKDELSGGYVELNSSGRREFNRLMHRITKGDNELLISLVAGMDLVHDLLDDLPPRELLYVIYTSPEYEDFVEHSIFYYQVVNNTTKQQLERILDSPKSGR